MAKPDQTEREIEQILAAAGGWVTLDFIRAQLFQRYRAAPGKTNLSNMLVGMAEKGRVAALEGKQATYRINNA